MASQPAVKDRLSRYFEEFNDAELSGSEEESDEYKTNKEKSAFISQKSKKLVPDSVALPSPNEVFEKSEKPEFLKCKQDIDWYKAARSSLVDKDVDLSDTHAVPPPKTYNNIMGENLKANLHLSPQNTTATMNNPNNSSDVDSEGEYLGYSADCNIVLYTIFIHREL